MLMQRTLDLSNYFIPGVPAIKDLYGLTTWYDGLPYMISANVASALPQCSAEAHG